MSLSEFLEWLLLFFFTALFVATPLTIFFDWLNGWLNDRPR